jgi:hypothetical protein
MSSLSFCPAFFRELIRRAFTAVLLLAAVVVLAHDPRPAVEPRAFSSSDVLWDASWTSGAFVDAGATLYRHDPEHFLCKAGGCPAVEVSDRVGQAVGIVCRRDPEGYVKLYYATDREPVWAFAADVHAKGPVSACGVWDW